MSTKNHNTAITSTNTEKKEGIEMKKVFTLSDIATAMAAADDARRNTDSLLAVEYLQAMDDMNTAISGYNEQLLHSQYDEMSTLSDVFTRRQYSPLHTQLDKKNDCFKAVARVTRFNVSDFVGYKEEEESPVSMGKEYLDAVKGLSTALMRFIQSEVTYDHNGGKKSVPVSVPVEALKKVMEIVGIEGVIARNRDVRFLAYTCTGGTSTIGALRDVSPEKVSSMLLDVYHVQMNNGKYAFETQGKDDQPAKK